MKSSKVVMVILVIVYLYCQNNLLSIKYLKYTSKELPESFDKYRIVHLSDLHCKEFGKNNWFLALAVNMLKPDIIVITGDLINANYYEEQKILHFMNSLRQIAPIYYVTGNHEIASKTFPRLQSKLEDSNISILRNSAVHLNRKGASIYLIGIDDPITTSMSENNFIQTHLSSELEMSLPRVDDPLFKILLSHRPEQLSVYTKFNINLVFSGHAHGGQVRLPFIGGLFAPGQSFPPGYTKGVYKSFNTTMIVSGGLGNSSLPQRINNRPEVILAILRNKK